MKLIYHTPLSTGHVSPFDEALQQVAHKADPLLLVSPYIGFAAINRMVDQAEDWRLLSDIEAWLLAGNQRHRSKCWAFIEDNIDRIRHIPDLHAKVAIGNNKVFLGSANFTDKGLLGRTEMSALSDDSSVVNEAAAWFNGLWESASAPVIEEGDALIEAINASQRVPFKARVKLSTTSSAVSSVLSRSKRPESGFDVAASAAKAEIAESIRFTSLTEAYRVVSDQFFTSDASFTFAELFLKILTLYSAAQKRDVWTYIIRETPHHLLGGLMFDGFDRYAYKDGKFQPWRASDLSMLATLDHYLIAAIESIPVHPETAYFPTDDKFTKFGVPTHHLLTLQLQILEAGLIEEQDEAGDLPRYSLIQDFEWPSRWRKFAKARSAFENKVKNARKANKETNKDNDDENELIRDALDEARYLRVESFSQPIFTDSNSPIFKRIISEIQQVASKNSSLTETVRLQHDEILSEAFKVMKSKSVALTVSDVLSISEVLKEHQVPPTIIAELNKKSGGAFLKVNKTDQIKPDIQWRSTLYLGIFPKALSAWWELV